MIRVAIITVSDGVAAGTREDKSGPALEEAASARLPGGAAIVGREVIPDEPDAIASRVRALADGHAADLILVSGGTGVAPRDRTPEAIRRIADLEIPGFGERMRAETGRAFPAAYLSRGLGVVVAGSVVLALPGSPRGAVECFEAVAELLPHAIGLASGGPSSHPRRS
jgi:molybdenum cofactor synthesis domain-containing protein